MSLRASICGIVRILMLDRPWKNTLALLLAILLPAFATAAKKPATSIPPEPPWTYRIEQMELLVPCRYEQEEPKCAVHRIVIVNPSKRMLECQVGIVYDGLNGDNLPGVSMPAVLMPKQTRVVLADRAPPNVAVASHEVTCKDRTPIDLTRLTRSCKTQFSKPVDVDTVYSLESRLANEAGSVIVELSLTREDAPPSDIIVVGSSLFPRLDQAALDAFSVTRGSTDCETGRFMFQVAFKLTHYGFE